MSQDKFRPSDDPHEGADKPTTMGKFKAIIRGEFASLTGLLGRWSLRLILIGAHLGLVVAACYFVVWWTARGAVYSSVDDVPVRMVGLVLGCVKKVGQYDNVFFNTRVDAAAKLYQAQKVQFLIVTGDNHRHGYDEPTDMKEALVAKGVPAARIYCDYAGFRTLDSIIRARAVFGQEDCTIISQHFHNERALYIAKRTVMPDAVAFDAEDANSNGTAAMYLREIPARVLALLDVEFLRTQPKFLGHRVPIGAKTPAIDAAPPKDGKGE